MANDWEMNRAYRKLRTCCVGGGATRKMKLFVLLGCMVFFILFIHSQCEPATCSRQDIMGSILCPFCWHGYKLDAKGSHKQVKPSANNILMDMGKPVPPPSPPSLLAIFTTFTSSPQKAQLFSNTVRNWATFIPHIRPILFSTDKNNSLNKLAESHGWMVVPCPKVNKHGTPVLKDMYFAAYKLIPELPFYAFVNGDIMFSHPMLTTLRRLVLELPVLNTTLVSGRRFEYQVPNEATFAEWSQEGVAKLVARSKLGIDWCEDYFLVTRDFPWHGIKDVVIGRVWYDDYLVARAIQMNVTTLDASLTMSALHQRGKYVDLNHQPGKDFNIILIGKEFPIAHGRTSKIQLRSHFDYKNDVIIKRDNQ